MVFELKVRIRTEDASYNKKFLVYEDIHFSPEDPEVKRCIEQALSEVKGTPEKVVITAKMDVE